MARFHAALSAVAMIAALGPFVVSLPVEAQPDTCPPYCDRVPDSAWIDPSEIPLYATYEWSALASLAVTARNPRFRFEEVCATPPAAGDPRDYSVASKASVTHPAGQWQLQVQILHWRGEARVGGPIADGVVHSANAALRACSVTAAAVSPSVTTDQAGRLAAAVSVASPTPLALRQYLVSHPPSGTVVELAMWAISPPAVAWPVIADEAVFDALIEPLCVAYVASCR